MEQSPFLEVNTHWATPHLLWQTRIHTVFKRSRHWSKSWAR